MYDLTALFTTIAAASASIVAILGGFIASKLISISGERDVVTGDLDSVQEEIRYKQETLSKLQEENNAEDALAFIDKHEDDLYFKKDIDQVYDKGEQQILAFDTLKPYWEKAVLLRDEFFAEMSTEKAEFNSKGIPKKLQQKYFGDSFSNSVLEIIESYIEDLIAAKEREERKRNSFFQTIDYDELTRAIKPVVARGGLSYFENEKEIERLKSAITFLNYRKGQLEKQKEQLKQPKGMRLGLWLFAVFTIACIITPLALCPFTTNNISVFHWAKWSVLGVFSVGMLCMFGYMVYLLKWPESD